MIRSGKKIPVILSQILAFETDYQILAGILFFYIFKVDKNGSSFLYKVEELWKTLLNWILCFSMVLSILAARQCTLSNALFFFLPFLYFLFLFFFFSLSTFLCQYFVLNDGVVHPWDCTNCTDKQFFEKRIFYFFFSLTFLPTFFPRLRKMLWCYSLRLAKMKMFLN